MFTILRSKGQNGLKKATKRNSGLTGVCLRLPLPEQCRSGNPINERRNTPRSLPF
jgi:hypothetical protein